MEVPGWDDEAEDGLQGALFASPALTGLSTADEIGTPEQKKRRRKKKRAPVEPEAPATPVEDPAASEKQAAKKRRVSMKKEAEQLSRLSLKSTTSPTEQLVKGKRPSAVERLQGARFRMLNEKLYTTTGDEAFKLFSQNPSLFEVYHSGFQGQVKRWPVNPVDKIIQYISALPPSLVVADFGCGEAVIAQSVPNTVHSFDLVAANEHVVACDMAHTPLAKGSVDIAVFCLSLMGTNYVDYLTEAHRVLRKHGRLRIAEARSAAERVQVKSRLLDTEDFVRTVEDLGFDFVELDDQNPMFVDMEFKRAGRSSRMEGAAVLQACIYKRR